VSASRSFGMNRPRRPRPLHEAVHEGWDIEVIVPVPAPRIEPGTYEAVSLSCRRVSRYSRTVLEIDFDVYEGALTDGRVLARLTLYLNWSKQPSTKSKLGRLLRCGGLQPSRGRPVTLQALERKAWRVRVIDAQHDQDGTPLTETARYSIIDDVLERLA
jgi:hypothetical protein